MEHLNGREVVIQQDRDGRYGLYSRLTPQEARVMGATLAPYPYIPQATRALAESLLRSLLAPQAVAQ